MKFRIVTDYYCGYEVQRKILFWWEQCELSNTHCTIEEAEEYARNYKRNRNRFKNKVVKYLNL